jgi:hypothetical protein
MNTGRGHSPPAGSRLELPPSGLVGVSAEVEVTVERNTWSEP